MGQTITGGANPPPLSFLQFLYGFPLFLIDFVTFFAFLGFQKVFLRFKGGGAAFQKSEGGAAFPKIRPGTDVAQANFLEHSPPRNAAPPVVGVRLFSLNIMLRVFSTPVPV